MEILSQCKRARCTACGHAAHTHIQQSTPGWLGRMVRWPRCTLRGALWADVNMVCNDYSVWTWLISVGWTLRWRNSMRGAPCTDVIRSHSMGGGESDDLPPSHNSTPHPSQPPHLNKFLPTEKADRLAMYEVVPERANPGCTTDQS